MQRRDRSLTIVQQFMWQQRGDQSTAYPMVFIHCVVDSQKRNEEQYSSQTYRRGV
jgi:hypothetical protein